MRAIVSSGVPSWEDAVRDAHGGADAGAPAEWYRIGGGHLRVRSDDERFAARLRALFAECRCPAPASGAAPVVGCDVRATADGRGRSVRFDDPVPIDGVRFALDVLDGSAVDTVPAPDGWTIVRRDGESVALSGNALVARSARGWPSFAGSLAVQRLIRLQRDALFFHAAAVALRGRAVLLLGAKASGKTTLALALAARGCAFLGDELVGVRADGTLLPVRRAVSIREGPAAKAVAGALATLAPRAVRYPDGGLRVRAAAGTLFPDAAATPARLAAALVLSGFAAAPRLEPMAAGAATMAALAPLPASLWGSPPGLRAVRTLSLFGRVPCRTVVHGSADETADRILHLLEEECR